MTIQAGDRFNRWTAVREFDRCHRSRIRWLFRCDCGTERVLRARYVEKKCTKSCGCARRSRDEVINEGDKFNQFTAVRFADVNVRGQYRWLFKCQCGKERNYVINTIKAGYVKSCGCIQKTRGNPIKVGDVFNNWTAIQFIGAQKNKANRRWLFRCGCGNERTLLSGSVKSGGSKSCGCLRRLSSDDRRVNAIIKGIKRGATVRKIPFSLSKSDVAKLAIEQNWQCAKTGIELDFSKRNGERKPFGPTIDRIDNSRGYAVDNIQLVCNLYNYCKNEHSDADVFLFAEALVAKSKK